MMCSDCCFLSSRSPRASTTTIVFKNVINEPGTVEKRRRILQNNYNAAWSDMVHYVKDKHFLSPARGGGTRERLPFVF